jgi:enolase-phosphatase E1
LLDIEGTTTPVAFVHQALFPYARARVWEFLQRHAADPEVRADLALLRSEHAVDALEHPAPPAWREDIAATVAYVHWLMDRDRKSTGLKSLQGKIWEAGYRSGELQGQVFPDVPPALARWHRAERDIAIFSSGSIQAQKLLFANSTAGDLTPFIRAYFDTTTGPKTEAQSYDRIAAALERSPSEALFLSDTIAELNAAKRAGMRTALCVRSLQAASPAPPGVHPVIRTFEEVLP